MIWVAKLDGWTRRDARGVGAMSGSNLPKTGIGYCGRLEKSYVPFLIKYHFY